jgi:hypothetical protein
MKLDQPSLLTPSIDDQKSKFFNLLNQTHNISNLNGRPITLIDGQVKITWESIFPTGYFQKANSILIVDPFLSDWHQLRNLLEVVNSILSRKILKDIFILTKPILEEDKDTKRNQWYKDASKHIYDQFGASLDLRIDSSIHDRFVVFDSGVVMSLGRGLDIYKPSNGERPPAMRPVRGCVITTFSN